MDSTSQRKEISKHHNCCCCCCCYHYEGVEDDNSKLINTPCLLDNETPTSASSYCSCCSSLEEKDTLTSSSFPNTACTTPIDFLTKDGENSTLEKTNKKKMLAIEELLQTERDYVKDLSYLVEVCLVVLNRQQWITKEHKSIIKRNSKDILNFHKQFIVYADTMSIYDNNWSYLATVFLDKIQQFSLYKDYCDLHSEALILTSEYRNRSEWTNFLHECSIADSYCIPLNLLTINTLDQQLKQQKKLHFDDYLIKPVQRICRYQLLIKEIIRYTAPETHEYTLWNLVLNGMQEIVTEIDDRKFLRDIQGRTDRFIDRLDQDWRLNKTHVNQLGNLLIAGAIEVTYSAIGQTVSKPRYLGCFVFATYIIFVRPKKATSYEPKHWFPLDMAEFEDLVDIEGQKEHSFIVKCKKHAFAFSASCSQEKQLWVKKLQEAINTAKTKASQNRLYVENLIISSLSGIARKRSSQNVRLSRSFTSISQPSSSSSFKHEAEEEFSKLPHSTTTIRFEDNIKLSIYDHPKTIEPIALKKRHSVDYSIFSDSKKRESILGKSNKRNSEMILSESRQSSVDTTIRKRMSLQFKNPNHLRDSVDRKLRDVCTEDYLSSKARYIRDQNPLPFETLLMDNVDTSNNLKKRKSTSMIRSSTLNLSNMIPTKKAELKQTKSELDVIDSTSHSSTSSNDPRRCSQFLLRRISQRCLSSDSYGSEGSTLTNSVKQLEKSPSKSKLFVGKILRRISSFHHTSCASLDTLDFNEENEFAEENETEWQQQMEPVKLPAFSYASTPPFSVKNGKNNKWKAKLSSLYPTRFLKKT